MNPDRRRKSSHTFRRRASPHPVFPAPVQYRSPATFGRPLPAHAPASPRGPPRTAGNQCARESRSVPFVVVVSCKKLFQPGAHFYIFRKSRQHRTTFRPDRSRHDHSVRLHPAQLAWREVSHHHHFASNQFFRFIELGNPCADLANLRCQYPRSASTTYRPRRCARRFEPALRASPLSRNHRCQ